jgi:cell division transport system ATP-binding protein
MELLLKVSRLGKTVIVVTHEQALVEHLDQRVVTISRGHIVSDRRNAAEEQGA